MKPAARLFAFVLALSWAAGFGLPIAAQIIQLIPEPGPEASMGEGGAPNGAVGTPDTSAATPPGAAAPTLPSSADAVLIPRMILPDERSRPLGEPGDLLEAATRMRTVPFRPMDAQVGDVMTPRQTGEVAVGRYVLVLPSDPGAAELLLSHRSSIDVLPDLSRLSVSVNGTPVGEIVPDNFSGFDEDRLVVPDGVLRAGRNTVEVVARHVHRVACGPDASFAVWTEIEAGTSGLSVPGQMFRPDAAGFLSAMAAHVAQGQPIQIRRSDPDAPLSGASVFVADLVAMLGGTPPPVEAVSFWTVAEGPPSLARITAVPAGQGPGSPRFARGGDGALVLLVPEDYDWAQLGRLFDNVAELTEYHGLSMLRPGEPTRMADLGFERLAVEGRYGVAPVSFRLPANWLVLTSPKATINLDYRFAMGLPEGALLLVKANGTTIRMLPLDNGDGNALPTLPVSFPARLLRPGANRIDFEVLVPGDPVDRMCPQLPGPVLEVSSGSTIFVPETPEMSLPSIDTALVGLAPERVGMTERAASALPSGILPQFAAALTTPEEIVPQAALVRGEGLSRLVVAAVSDLETIDPTIFGGDLSPLSEALSRERFQQIEALNVSQARAQTATAWDSLDGDEVTLQAPATGIMALPQTIVTELREMALASQPFEEWLAKRNATAAILQPFLERPGEIWLVLGPQADAGEVARSLAVNRDRFDGPAGQIAIYARETGWQTWASPERQLRLHEPLSAGNLREIMGTYATLTPLPFIATILGFAGLSVLFALGFLLSTRGRRA